MLFRSKFARYVSGFLVLILIASAVISGMLGDVESAAVIVIVISINAILGTVQTVKAEQSLQSLKKLSGPEAKVLRNGVAVQLPARELVVDRFPSLPLPPVRKASLSSAGTAQPLLSAQFPKSH